MDSFVDIIARGNDFVNGIVWGPVMLVLIAAVGLYFTIRLGFFQFKNAGFLFRQTIVRAFRSAKDGSDKKVSATLLRFRRR